MEYAKLVGFSFGINEVVPSVVEQKGSGEEEGSGLKLACGQLRGSSSKIGVEDTEKGVLHGSSLEVDLGTGTCRRGNGFSSLYGAFSGFAETVNLNEKDGRSVKSFNLNGLGMTGVASEFREEAVKSGSQSSQKNHKKGIGKTSKLLEGDPDWLPEQENGIRSLDLKKRSNLVGKKAKPEYSRNGKDSLEEHDGIDVSKPVILCLPAPNSVKQILLSSGWMVVPQEGSGDPLYVSPSGSVYGSLPKALEAFSHDASKYREKQWDSFQLTHRGGLCRNSDPCGSASGSKMGPSIGLVAKNTPDKKFGQWGRTTIVTSHVQPVVKVDMLLKNQENIKESSSIPIQKGFGEVHNVVPCCMVDEKAESCVKDECLFKETKRLNFSSGVVSQNKHNHYGDKHQGDRVNGVRRSVHIDGKHVPITRKFNMQIAGGEDFLNSSKCEVMVTENLTLQKPETHKEILEEALPVPEEKGYRQVPEVVAVGEKVKFCMKDECLNHENQSADCCSRAVIKDNRNNDVATNQDGELHGVRRSLRLNGRHVPVDTELDIETCNYDYYLDSSDSVDMLTTDMLLGTQKLDNEIDKEASPMPIEIRHGEVNKVLASCMADEEAKSCSPIDMLTEDMLLKKQKTVNKNNKDALAMREELRYREEHEELAFHPADEKAKCCCYVDMLMQDMLPLKQEPDKENDNGDSPMAGERRYREVHDILASCMADGKEKSCTKDDCLCSRTKKLNQSGAIVVNNDQDGDSDIHQDEELVGLRRSARINGKHVPIDTELDMDMWAIDEFIDSSCFVVNRVEKKDKEKPSNSISKLANIEGGLPTTATVKQTATGKSDYQKPRNQKQLGSNSALCRHEKVSKKCSGVKTPVPEKGFPSLGKNEKILMAEKQSSLFVSKRKSVHGGCLNGKKKKKRSGGCGLMVRRTGKGDCGENFLSKTKFSILSWLIDTGILAENEKVVYKIENGKGDTMRGYITRGGIRCNCCKKVWSLLEFEAHAGSNIHKPWNIIFLISGKSLMQCQSEAWEKEKQRRKVGFQTVGVGDADPSDDTCGICADGGNLICCDGCPSTFHQDCVMLKSLPEGSWYCPFCRCACCMLAYRGQDELILNLSLLQCNQCGCKYHKDCVVENDMDKMSSNSLSFCGKHCKKVAAGLSDLLGVSNPLGGGFSWTLLRCLDEDNSTSSDQRLSFIMECNVKLLLALSVLEECFTPLVDPRTGLDMISQAVYNCGSNFNRLNYERFYTVILEKDEEIITVATIRLHGIHLAEMPFIGTRPNYRRQGMCRHLLNAIENMLSSLHVEKLIIPAIPDLLETWMTSFSFRPLELSHRDEIRKLSMMLFADTTLLQKSLRNTDK